MQNKPLLSIISSIYNGGNNLLRFLDSISNQTYDNIEVILVNDFSTDPLTLEIIQQLKNNELQFNKKLKLIENDENLGLLKSFQKGLDIANGEYFAFPESDDYLDYDFYEVLMKEAIKNKANVVKGLLLNVYDNRNNQDDTDENEQFTFFDNVALPIAVRNSNNQIVSYIMPDITYSWFYVFDKNILSDGYKYPIFENAILYGFSKAPFELKYKESIVSIDKASFYYYNAHDGLQNGGSITSIGKDATNKLYMEKKIVENLVKKYDEAINKC